MPQDTAPLTLVPSSDDDEYLRRARAYVALPTAEKMRVDVAISASASLQSALARSPLCTLDDVRALRDLVATVADVLDDLAGSRSGGESP